MRKLLNRLLGLFKKADAPEIDTFSETQIELQVQTFDRYPVGRELDYMGVKIRITGHTHYSKRVQTEYFSIMSIDPEIKCDYVTKSGQIKHISFSCREAMTWAT